MKSILNEMDSQRFGSKPIWAGTQIWLGIGQSVEPCYLGSSAWLQLAWHNRMKLMSGQFTITSPTPSQPLFFCFLMLGKRVCSKSLGIFSQYAKRARVPASVVHVDSARKSQTERSCSAEWNLRRCRHYYRV